MEIKIPAVGESITEGTIAQWLKKDGDVVQQGDTLFELETEKATTEVPAPVAGVLHIQVPVGKTAAIGTVVGSIDENGTAAARSTGKSEASVTKTADVSERPRPAEKPGPSTIEQSTKATPDGKGSRRSPTPASTPPERIESPASERSQEVPVKRESFARIEEHGTRLPSQVAAEPAGERETRQPMSAIRQRIGERLLASQKNTATLTTFNEADLSAIMTLRARYKDAFQKKHGVSLGFMSFFVKAVVEALRAFPLVNAWIEDNEVVFHHYYNIGVAVSTEKGLMVPVLRDADRLSFAEVEKRIARLAERARSRKISVEDLQGGTFTITNGGIFGSMLSTPILNPPQSAILGMHAIQKRPVVVNDQVVIRPMMYLALSYDHRLIDGREAVVFLARVKECIESPERLMLEI